MDDGLTYHDLRRVMHDGGISADKMAPAPTTQLRLARTVHRPDGWIDPPVLQQLWAYADGRTEWRSVPIVDV